MSLLKSQNPVISRLECPFSQRASLGYQTTLNFNEFNIEMSLEHLKKNREGRIAGLLLSLSHYDGVLQLISEGEGVRASRQSKNKTGE